MKSKRHSLILRLIAENNIETQEELMAMLNAEGVNVTQATVSRDIKELRLLKVQNEKGSYKYATSSKVKNTDISYKFHSIFTQSVIEVNCAQNIVAIKCYTGMANAACASMDSLGWNGIVGTLAGDDTIFILATDNSTAEELAKQLKRILKGNKEIDI